MKPKNESNTFYAATRQDWRDWLDKNHESENAVWLIIYRKESPTPSIYYPEAVDEALCYGWIDSLPNKRDEESYYQFFSKRKPASKWSEVNKQKVAKLMLENKIQPAGLKMIELAKETGTWNALNDVDALKLPADLEVALEMNQQAFENWNAFSRSSRRGILEWILNAKKPETREKRIAETVRLAAENIKANHP